MSEIKVGDRVLYGSYGVTIVAISDGKAWVKWPGGDILTTLGALTRIEPDVPQPKFSEGQRVRTVNAGVQTVSAITPAYITATGRWYFEHELEAVPACSHCGQEMPDG